jgi:hypothetical protein
MGNIDLFFSVGQGSHASIACNLLPLINTIYLIKWKERSISIGHDGILSLHTKGHVSSKYHSISDRIESTSTIITQDMQH